jgi:sodium/potassium-transporting ATPase subunit alpha
MAYVQMGMIQVAVGFVTYFMIMAKNGFLPSCLFDLMRKSWESKYANNLQNSFGQEGVCISPFI